MPAAREGAEGVCDRHRKLAEKKLTRKRTNAVLEGGKD
jgi:hypothetical protein